VSTWSPVGPDDLPERLAAWLDPEPDLVRLAVDGPPCADPHGFAAALAGPLAVRGRPLVHVRSETFWRDRSLRLEYGHEDPDAYLDWLDHDALRREVLAPAVTDGVYLPSLRDPDTDRSTRESPRPVGAGTVLVVSGPFLLGLGLPFDRVVHLAVSAAARARRTPEADAWTLPAFDSYDATVDPAALADVVVKLDDPRHPAVRGL
jgi:hypothetical protein